MELLAQSLEGYKDLVGNTAAICTVVQFFSPAVLCNDIRKQGNTKDISIMPFLGGIVIGVLNLQYGLMLRDDTMIRVSFVGVLLNVLYYMFYFIYTEEKNQAWVSTGVAGAICIGVLGLILGGDPAVAEDRLGYVVTIFMMTLIASPLFNLKTIIKTKSTAGMPFPIIFSGTIVSFLWLLYGIILRNDFVVFQNVVGFGLSVVQLALMAIYPAKPEPKKKTAKKNN